jgi:uncharacterized protein YggU (UPF0235/DUF167 family)
VFKGRLSPVRLGIDVRPNSSRTRAGGTHDGALVVRVATPAESGRATQAALAAVADALGVPSGSVTLVRGATSRRKVLDVATNTTEEQWLLERLRQLLTSEG